MVDGVFSLLLASGEWVTKELSPAAEEFLKRLPERHVGDLPGLRRGFEIRRLKSKDNLWKTRKGLEFIPRGPAKLFARKEEVVDVGTGQPVEVEHFNDQGKCVWRMRVKRHGKHKGVVVAEDVETESIGPVGRVWQRMRTDKVEVELDDEEVVGE